MKELQTATDAASATVTAAVEGSGTSVTAAADEADDDDDVPEVDADDSKLLFEKYAPAVVQFKVYAIACGVSSRYRSLRFCEAKREQSVVQLVVTGLISCTAFLLVLSHSGVIMHMCICIFIFGHV